MTLIGARAGKARRARYSAEMTPPLGHGLLSLRTLCGKSKGHGDQSAPSLNNLLASALTTA